MIATTNFAVAHIATASNTRSQSPVAVYPKVAATASSAAKPPAPPSSLDDAAIAALLAESEMVLDQYGSK